MQQSSPLKQQEINFENILESKNISGRNEFISKLAQIKNEIGTSNSLLEINLIQSKADID
jgi:hypothetical protein